MLKGVKKFNDNIDLQEKEKPIGEPGYCIHYFAHRGIGKIIEKTQNWQYLKKLFLEQDDDDILYFGCGPTEKFALYEYKKAENKYKIEKKKRKSKKSQKTKSKKSQKTKSKKSQKKSKK